MASWLIRMVSSSGKSSRKRRAICSGPQAVAQRRSCRRPCRRPFHGTTGPCTAAPFGATTIPASRSCTERRRGSLIASLAAFGRRAERSACHCAVVARYSRPPLRVAALRRSSREIVDGARSSRRAISRTPCCCARQIAISSRSANDRERPDSGFDDGARWDGGMPPALRNQRAPTAGDTPAPTAASSLEHPAAMAAQNRWRSSRRATEGRPGEGKAPRPDRSERRFRTVIATSSLKVLRRPLEPGLIAAITSCTNTSNPALMVGAGLLARNARRAGLQVPPWVKTSLSPGSQAVTDYLVQSGLQDDLDALGFNLTGYGCMTCIGNSGGLDEAIAGLTDSREIVGAAVLSGNRNFEGRINPHIKAAYLASPALVVAYALAGSVLTDLRTEPVAFTPSGDPVRLDQIWPSDEEIQSVVNRFVNPDIFAKRFGDVFTGPDLWQNIGGTDGIRFSWSPESTYIRRPPYFEGLEVTPPGLSDVFDARALVVVGDSITTDHISPAGAIPLDSLAGQYLK